jgi:DNA modification methylase
MAKSATSGKTLFSGQATPAGGVSYAGDKPNPELRAFVERHMAERPYDPSTDGYNVPAFDKPIETTKATASYNVHTYWSKKPHDAIRQYIRHYTKPGDLVLDSFCGSGGTAIAALLECRKAISIDRSPAAASITAAYSQLFSCLDFSDALEKLGRLVVPKIAERFVLKQGQFVKAAIYTERFRCVKCYEPVPFILAESGDEHQFRGRTAAEELCPTCGEPISTNTDERMGFVPAELHVAESLNARRLTRIAVLGDESVAERFPVRPRRPPAHLLTPLEGNIQPRLWKNLKKAGAITAADLFSDANLEALQLIDNNIKHLDGVTESAKALLHLALHAVLYNCTRMYRHRTKTAGGGGYLSKCLNPWPAFADKCREIERAIQEASTESEQGARLHVVSNDSATCLSGITDDSIDYIFTDPPYGGTYHYGALNLLWEVWRGSDLGWRSEEVIVTEDGSLTFADWGERLRKAMHECYRVLKPGRWVSLCFHRETELWEAVNDIMAEVGFVAAQRDAALFIETGQKSYNQVTGATAKKRDLVINFRKPRPSEAGGSRLVIPEGADAKTFADLARQVIRNYLQANPASTKDRLYDDLVSRMVRAGQMRAHNFDELLREVADEVKDAGGASRWYLKETEEGQVDAAEAAKEDAAAKAMEKFIAKTLEKSYAEGVHYSDLFEHYLYAVKDKPRRSLADWLPDYFFKTEDGTWRLPVDEDERELKEQARASGENRRIKRYAAMLQAGVAVPKERVPTAATLAEWIRHAKRSGLYEAGKLLYERGGLDASKLSEEQQVEVEEDYQVCVRALQRAAGGKAPTVKKKKGRKKKSD